MQKKKKHSKLGSDSLPFQKTGHNCCFYITFCQRENKSRWTLFWDVKTTCLKSSKTVPEFSDTRWGSKTSPSIPSSSEIQQFSARTGEKKIKNQPVQPLLPDWELAEQRVTQWAAGEENVEEKKGKVCRKTHEQSSPTGSVTWTAQQHHSFSTYRLHVQGQKGAQQLQYFRGTRVKQI